jgi:hypothetical protein
MRIYEVGRPLLAFSFPLLQPRVVCWCSFIRTRWFTVRRPCPHPGCRDRTDNSLQEQQTQQTTSQIMIQHFKRTLKNTFTLVLTRQLLIAVAQQPRLEGALTREAQRLEIIKLLPEEER